MKKIISILLSVVMVLSLVPMTEIASLAATSGDYTYTVLSETDKTCEITEYTGSATELTIPSTLDGYTVTSIGRYAFYGCTSLTSVTIPDSVTSIGWGVFYGCTSLASITIPDSVTSIGDYAFDDCTSLTSITIPDSVTNIKDDAFNSCTSLASVTIPSSVTSIGGAAFCNCTSLTSITMPESVISIKYNAFYHCTSLMSINVSESNKNYCSVDGVLFNKDKTELIIYPEGKTDTSYTIPESVTSIGEEAFYGCSSLTNITIPDNVTNIGGWAFGDTSLISITIPDSVTSIGPFAFYHCTLLTNITIPGSVEQIGARALGYYSDENTSNDLARKEDFTISGYTGSAAETYANANDFTFISLSGECKHEYGSWKVTTAATATKNGVETRTCSVCGETETRSIAALGYIQMYRLYNPNSGEHFYTANSYERDNLVSLGWSYEGIGWYAPKSSSTPVYRLYNAQGGEHHYTRSAAEKDNLVKLGWSYEGIGWYSDDNRGVALYRQYNPNAYANNHNYTTNLGESNYLVSLGWQAEGVGWYGVA